MTQDEWIIAYQEAFRRLIDLGMEVTDKIEEYGDACEDITRLRMIQKEVFRDIEVDPALIFLGDVRDDRH